MAAVPHPNTSISLSSLLAASTCEEKHFVDHYNAGCHHGDLRQCYPPLDHVYALHVRRQVQHALPRDARQHGAAVQGRGH